jgi:hypothetical protein
VIYLRPTPSSKPVKYTETIEKAGLVVSAKHSIALYTCKAGAKQGPAGETGEPGEPYLWDTIIASASSEYDDLEVDLIQAATHFRAPFPITIEYIRVSLSVAPIGSDVIVDVHMNGFTLFSTPIHIDPGMKSSVGSATPAVLLVPNTPVPDDAEFTVFITQVGITTTGSGVKVAITGKKVQV